MENLFLLKNKYEITSYQGEVVTINKNVTKCPDEKGLRTLGYKEIVNTIRPNAKDGCYIDTYYEDDGKVIKQCYEQIPLK